MTSSEAEASAGRCAASRSRISSDQNSRLTGEYGLGSGGSELKVGSSGSAVTRSPPRSRTQAQSVARSRRSPSARLRDERSAASWVPTPQLRGAPSRRQARTGAAIAVGEYPAAVLDGKLVIAPRQRAGCRKARRPPIRASSSRRRPGAAPRARPVPAAAPATARRPRPRGPGGCARPAWPRGARAWPPPHRPAARPARPASGGAPQQCLGPHHHAAPKAIGIAGMHTHGLREGAKRPQLIHASSRSSRHSGGSLPWPNSDRLAGARPKHTRSFPPRSRNH